MSWFSGSISQLYLFSSEEGPLCQRPVSLREGQKMECLERSYTLTLSAPKYTISEIYSAVAITIFKNVQS